MTYYPLVSVFIPVFNAGIYLRPAFKSILFQSYSKIEIIIIDDGSTDNCLNTIHDLADSRTIILRQNNLGKSVAINRAIEMAKGAFYLIQDADDLSCHNRIECLLQAMCIYPHTACVLSGYDLIINNKRVAPRLQYKNIDECKKDIENMRMPSHDPTAMFRMSMIRDMKYAHELKIGQGFDYILRIGEKFPLVVINKCLYSYRINLKSNTRSIGNMGQIQVKSVLERACIRRGMACSYNKSDISPFLPSDYGIVAHFMESVLDLKRSGRIFFSLKTALTCLLIQPNKLAYYKPMLYFLLPIAMVNFYRFFKDHYK